MLDIKLSVYDDDRDAISTCFLNGCSCTATEAATAVDQAYELRELSSRRGGVSGHKAWISIRQNDVSLMLYFMGPDVDFELGRMHVPDDQKYCNGELQYDRLAELLTIVDDGSDPIDYLNEHAATIDCSPRE